MTQPDLILKLIEQLLAERDKNNQLQSKLKNTKRIKTKYVIHSRSGKVVERSEERRVGKECRL